MFLKLFVNVMIRNIKIHNIHDIINNLEFMEPKKYIHFLKNKDVHLNVSYDFSKFNASKKIKV